MNEITSLTNPAVKETVKLHQKKYRDKFIIVEGKKALSGAKEARLQIKTVFSSDKNLLEEYKGAETYFVNEKIMEKISTTESAPNITAIVERPHYTVKDFQAFKRIVLLDGIKDAGNLGTIIRTCAAFDVDGILLFGDCTDEYSPKTIRSAAGNIFKIPLAHCTAGELQSLKKTRKIVSTVVNSKNDIRNFDLAEPYIIMFGSEAQGLCEELLSLSDMSFTVTMKKGVESLNLAVSAGIILYETYKVCKTP